MLCSSGAFSEHNCAQRNQAIDMDSSLKWKGLVHGARSYGYLIKHELEINDWLNSTSSCQN